MTIIQNRFDTTIQSLLFISQPFIGKKIRHLPGFPQFSVTIDSN
jgi:hypothetical protein